MQLKRTSLILWVSLALAWSFDFLFWEREPGISFFIFVALNLAAGLLLARLEGVKTDARSLALLLPVLFFSAMTFVRREPLTTFLNGVMTLTLMMFLTLTLQSGLWLRYSLGDMLANTLRLAFSLLTGGSGLLASGRADSGAQAAEAEHARLRVRPWGVVRGLLLAFPVVLILALLLSSADPIFSKELNNLLKLEKWTEYALRGVYICILAYLLSGVLAHALSKSGDRRLIGVEQPWLKPFLGWTEAAVVLGAVNLLFIFFVGVQLRYFFGGHANITLEGFTYSEYARRGFAELVFVAFLSLLLFLGLSQATRRLNPAQRRVFSGLGITLVGLVLVILVSAFQRLLMYEAAYGFTRLRTYTHVFIIWLGVLLLATILLEIVQRERLFAIAALSASLGFVITLNALNVDASIVRFNTTAALRGGSLDTSYFSGLSSDAVPALAEVFQTTRSAYQRDDLGAVLSCTQDNLADAFQSENWTWRSYHQSDQAAYRILQGLNLKAYPLSEGEYGEKLVRLPDGREYFCTQRFMD